MASPKRLVWMLLIICHGAFLPKKVACGREVSVTCSIEARSHQQHSYPNKARVKSLPQKIPKSCM